MCVYSVLFMVGFLSLSTTYNYLLPCPLNSLQGGDNALVLTQQCAAQRFAWEINPRNYLLLACHAANETVQLNQLRRWYGYHYGDPTKETPQVQLPEAAATCCNSQLSAVLLAFSMLTSTLQSQETAAWTAIPLSWAGSAGHS